MNRFIRLNKDCPKGCWQNCEYSSECLPKLTGIDIWFIFSKVKAIISRSCLILKWLFKCRADDYKSTKPYRPILPSAKYVFSRTNKTEFVLEQHIGKQLFDIQTIFLEESPLPMMFSHSINDDRGSVIATLTFLPDFKRKACGGYNNHAMLIGLTEDRDKMTLLFFENMSIYQTELLQRWNIGRLVIEVEIMPLLEINTGKRLSEKCIYTNVHLYTLLKNLKKRLSPRTRNRRSVRHV